MTKEGIQSLAVGRKDILRIDPRDLNIRDGFNCRDVNFDPKNADDLALAESIAAVGVKQPLTAIWDSGKAWITDGHRRLLAALYAIEHLGAEIKSVPVQTEDRYASEAERVLSQVVRNNGKPLTPIEHSRVYKRLMDLGWTEKQIAESIGRTVQWVRNLLELNTAPVEVTNMVRSGQVSATLAMDTLRKAKGDSGKAAAQLTEAVAGAAAIGKTKATKKHVRTLADIQAFPKAEVPATPAPAANPPPLKIVYTNWRGETGKREVIPEGIWYGTTKWHPEEQWFLSALDVSKGEIRDFAMRDIILPTPQEK